MLLMIYNLNFHFLIEVLEIIINFTNHCTMNSIIFKQNNL